MVDEEQKVSLNIKNARVHSLARELAARTGRSQTRVVELALQRLLAELDEDLEGDDHRLDQALAVAADFEHRLTDAERDRLSTDLLYDARGLPR